MDQEKSAQVPGITLSHLSDLNGRPTVYETAGCVRYHSGIRRLGDIRARAVVTAALALLPGCATTPPPPKNWDSLPVRLALSSSLSDCQLQSMHIAARELESWAGSELFTLELVPADSLDVSGLPRAYTVAVTANDPTRPESQADTGIYADADGRIHSASINLGRHCSVRVALHELSHALGLEDVADPDNLMYSTNTPSGPTTLTDEQRTAVLIGTVTRIARPEPGSKATTVRAVGGEGL